MMDDEKLMSQDETKRTGAWSSMTPLPENFVPGENDVICSWARQNHKHSKSSRINTDFVEQLSYWFSSKDQPLFGSSSWEY